MNRSFLCARLLERDSRFYPESSGLIERGLHTLLLISSTNNDPQRPTLSNTEQSVFTTSFVALRYWFEGVVMAPAPASSYALHCPRFPWWEEMRASVGKPPDRVALLSRALKSISSQMMSVKACGHIPKGRLWAKAWRASGWSGLVPKNTQSSAETGEKEKNLHWIINDITSNTQFLFLYNSVKPTKHI